MSDWIEHDGKGAPDLPPGTRVQVRMGQGWESRPEGVEFEIIDWRWVDPFDDIKAYRVIPNDR